MVGEAKAETKPIAQDAVKVDPRSYKVLVENDEVRVIEHVSRPRMGVCGTGMHSHPDHVTVCLTAAKAKVKLADGTTATVENKAGDTWFEPAVTHSVENVGGGDVHVYLVELKKKA
jgi:hypothetical protein